MKTILILCAAFASLFLSACVGGGAPAAGPTQGAGENPHTGNTEGGRTELTRDR
jgi:hypothetical protein